MLILMSFTQNNPLYNLLNVADISLDSLYVCIYVQSVQPRATGWMAEESGFHPRQGQEIFLFSTVSKPPVGPTQTPIQWVPGLCHGELSGLGVKLPNLVPTLRMVVLNPTPPCVFAAWFLIKHRDNFTFTCNMSKQILT
jgi:hypothetical protein